MTRQPVSIIVVTYNRLEYFKTFVEFLHLFTEYPFVLIVVDNGSTDGTREEIIKLKQQGLINDYIFNKENLKLAAAFTEGYKIVQTELFVTVADDMIPPMFKKPDWLSVLVAKMKTDQSVGCINLVATRCSFKDFNRKTRPGIYQRLKK